MKADGVMPVLSAKLQGLLSDYVSRLKNVLQTQLSRVVLFGSYARGEETADSDVDVLVLLNVPEDELVQCSDDVAEVSYDVYLESGYFIEELVVPAQAFRHWGDVLPLYQSVRREGVLLYAA